MYFIKRAEKDGPCQQIPALGVIKSRQRLTAVERFREGILLRGPQVNCGAGIYFTAKPSYFSGNLVMVGGVLTFYLKSVVRFNDQCG